MSQSNNEDPSSFFPLYWALFPKGMTVLNAPPPLCVGVCVCPCLCACRLSGMMSPMWKPENNPLGVSSCHLLFCLHFPSPSRRAGMTDDCHSSSISNKFWGWNLDQQACAGVRVCARTHVLGCHSARLEVRGQCQCHFSLSAV